MQTRNSFEVLPPFPQLFERYEFHLWTYENERFKIENRLKNIEFER